MTLETLIQFRRHWRAIDMLLEREINQMQEEQGLEKPRQPIERPKITENYADPRRP